VSEAGGEAAGGGGRGADTELKTKTPHVNVGKKNTHMENKTIFRTIFHHSRLKKTRYHKSINHKLTQGFFN